MPTRSQETDMTPEASSIPVASDSRSPTAEPGFGRFFLPGPTEVHPEVLAAQVHPMIGHRGKAMVDLMADLQPGLRRLFRTERPVYIAPSSATGLMEAAVRNCALARVLALVNGAFSERFRQIAASNGLEVDTLEIPWGLAHSPYQVAQALDANSYDAVTVVHSETSTGALNPIGEIARVVHEAGDVVVLVDSVTGLAGAPVESDEWKLDFVLTGSQKALALPPGWLVDSRRMSESRRSARARPTASHLREGVRSACQTPGCYSYGRLRELEGAEARCSVVRVPFSFLCGATGRTASESSRVSRISSSSCRKLNFSPSRSR